MRTRLVDASMLARWSGLALWFGLASALPFRAISPTLTVFTLIGLTLGMIGVSRISPVGVIAVHVSGRLASRLKRAARVTLVGHRARVDPLVALLAAGMLWILPLCAGAYAVKHPGFVGAAIAFVVLAASTFGAAAMILGRDREIVTLGADGLRTSMWGFVPYASITSTAVDGDDLRVRRDGGADLLLPVGAMAGVVAAELTRRRTAHASTASPEREVHARVAAVPIEELVATLRDGSVPREERVRVASIVKGAAPAEVERLATETADEDLATILRG